MSLVDGAFNLHNAASASIPATSAIPGGQPHGPESEGSEQETAGTNQKSDRSETRNSNRNGKPSFPPLGHGAIPELIQLLPDHQAAALLVDTYFDRVHWFMLIFHQDDFRQRWPEVYLSNRRPKTGDLGFLSTFLMVLAIGLQYIGEYRRHLLVNYGIVPEELKDAILSRIRTRLLDIVAVGSLEAVQTCVLLGTYYLYHGAPRLAWPVCGCGLRIAQALGLHRKVVNTSQLADPPVEMVKRNEARKRSWWAIYEIETFCSMSYGYPHSIRDADCDVEPLDPSAKSEIRQSPKSFDDQLTGEATLLSYKYYKSKLSVITKNALAELYGVGPNSPENSQSNNPSNPHALIKRVSEFDHKLQAWHQEIPAKLRWRADPGIGVSYSSPDELDRDVGASGPRFENHVYQLQGLALKLAYENSRILVHRPVLSFKLVTKPADQNTSVGTGSSQATSYLFSTQACHDAAMRISETITSPIVDIVSATYAASFAGIHTFTAGVTLGILSSIEPLTSRSGEAKVGLHRLMGAQRKLRSRSVLAGQGLEILQRLTKLVMEKELHVMLDLSKPEDYLQVIPGAQDSNDDACATSILNTGCNIPSGPDPAAIPEGESVALDDPINDRYLEYIQNPALTEALSDFDQALLFQNPPFSESDDVLGSSIQLPADEGFPMPEQTWIWGWDNLPPHF
ncbi:hypothetical protein P170DRAFT_458330 [Aspergillus steynii IBT 23096]|uniref:Xylanolytic transcriptional activator regulatory domain-containing protein n=1 Tax=Aspergillus steynii IBT 23096 TaxID=1392250 RepID=A0A2I2G030_9EURO|nr:uncharacterized protein P170DRAFT_458330 [Aspergillus steynii IBT 23096]PLB46233.1 hypothetical protein P170DRAFT_458330 [Aspergillus steynii IBT 23096]